VNLVKKKLKIGNETLMLTFDPKQSTKAKKVYKGKNTKGKQIKYIELDMQPKNKDERE